MNSKDHPMYYKFLEQFLASNFNKLIEIIDKQKVLVEDMNKLNELDLADIVKNIGKLESTNEQLVENIKEQITLCNNILLVVDEKSKEQENIYKRVKSILDTGKENLEVYTTTLRKTQLIKKSIKF